MNEVIVNGFLLIISLSYLINSNDFSFGSLKYPKAGFMPQIIGWLATAISFYLFIKSLLKKDETKNKKPNLINMRLGFVLVILLIYALTMKTLGYIISTFFVLFSIQKIANREGWLVPILISAGGSIGLYLIFKTLLSVPLPGIGILN